MNPEKHLQDVVCDRGGDNGRWSGDASLSRHVYLGDITDDGDRD